jgi:hypothetical protein
MLEELQATLSSRSRLHFVLPAFVSTAKTKAIIQNFVDDNFDRRVSKKIYIILQEQKGNSSRSTVDQIEYRKLNRITDHATKSETVTNS